jgi:hypothetical protein
MTFTRSISKRTVTEQHTCENERVVSMCTATAAVMSLIYWLAVAATGGLSRNKCWATEVHVCTSQTDCGTKV